MCPSNTDVFSQWIRMWTANTNVTGLFSLTGEPLIGSPAGFFIWGKYHETIIKQSKRSRSNFMTFPCWIGCKTLTRSVNYSKLIIITISFEKNTRVPIKLKLQWLRTIFYFHPS